MAEHNDADIAKWPTLVATAISLATLQGAGAVLTATFNVGSTLPTNARLLAAEINVTQAFAGTGFATAVATLQGGSDAAGTIRASTSIAATGLVAPVGSNPYLSRSGQQIKVTVTLTGCNLNALTAGAFTVNVYYSVL